MGVKKSAKRIKKDKFFERIYQVFDKYSRALFVDCDNVSAKQLHAARKELRENDSLVLMGKNTLIRAALTKRLAEPNKNDDDYEERVKTWKPLPEAAALLPLIKNNVGIIFTNKDLTDVKDIIDKHAKATPAKVGQIAQCDVWIQSGPTGLDPKQTLFFQNLQIPTKIVKTQINIESDVKIITEGDKVEANQTALLNKLGVEPFSYKLIPVHVYDNGNVYGPGVLNITTEKILESYKKVISNVASISLESGIPTAASAPHTVMRVFKNLLAVTMETDFTFAQADALKAAAAAGPAPAAEEEKDEEPEAEEEKEESADDMEPVNIFPDDDEY